MHSKKIYLSSLYLFLSVIPILGLTVISFFSFSSKGYVNAQEVQTDIVNQDVIEEPEVQVISAPLDKTIIYTQTGCPHCEKVEEFVKLNNLTENVLIKDIAKDKTAYEEFTKIYDNNSIAETDRYIPMTVISYNDPEKTNEIVNGDTPIIDLLISRYGVTDPIYEEASTFSIDTNILIVFGSVVAIIFIIYGIYFLVSRKNSK